MARPARKQTGPIGTCGGQISRLAYAWTKQQGIDVDGLLRHAGLTRADVEDRDARLRVTAQVKFLDLVADAVGDPDFGFHLARDFDLREALYLYYVGASAETLGQALSRIARYSALANDGIVVRVEKGRRVRVSFQYTGVARHTDRHQIEFWITALIRICRHFAARDIKPIALRVAHHRTYGPDSLQQFAGIRIETGAGIDECDFAGAIWDLPVVTTDQHLHRLLVQYCEEALSRMGAHASPLRARVENAVAELLPHGQAQAEIVATRLAMSPRTLARRLSSEGLSFAAILQDLRSALAHRYLAEPSVPISQIAWLLGYREIGNFTHAFRRWTGTTPSTARARLQQPADGA